MIITGRTKQLTSPLRLYLALSILVALLCNFQPFPSSQLRSSSIHDSVSSEGGDLSITNAAAYKNTAAETSELHFATGFGLNGNDITKPNLLGNMGVSFHEAHRVMQDMPLKLLQSCPTHLQPEYWIGPPPRRLLCGLHQLKDNENLFSFGSNGEFDFEDEIHKILPNMNITIFDPTMSNDQPTRQKNGYVIERSIKYATEKGYNFVPMGIAYQPGKLKMENVNGNIIFENAAVNTLPNLMKYVGIKANNSLEKNDKSGASAGIGVLKLDASGEMEIFYQLSKDKFPLGKYVGILLVEVHMYHPQLDRSKSNCCYGESDLNVFFDYLRNEGFILVGMEQATKEGCCADLSFVNPNYPGFSTTSS